jgi:hypothetical protein
MLFDATVATACCRTLEGVDTKSRTESAVMRVPGIILWASIGGVLFGWGTEYGPVFSDPPAERSVGDALAKAIVFGLFVAVPMLVSSGESVFSRWRRLGLGVTRYVRERHNSSDRRWRRSP